MGDQRPDQELYLERQANAEIMRDRVASGMSDKPIPKFDPELIRQLGRLVIGFGQLQITLDLLMASLISQDQRVGRIVGSHVQFAALLNLIRALFINAHGEADSDYARLSELLNEADAVSVDRNRLIHSAWAISDEGVAATIRTPPKLRKGFKVESIENVSDATVEPLVARCQKLSGDLLALYQALGAAGKVARYTAPGEGLLC